ncbi:MAG TPA: T9SS type A sorting domain-containing protein [Candidatus Marinimicrobia bacterium]|nr:T9SS type A sorting domain-containing protein [Candidatus Neomarinimicrobiota bacterium]
MKAAEAWDVHQGDPSIIICIIDSGTDYTHPDLKDVLWINPGEDINVDGVLTAADSNCVDDDGNGFIDDFHGWDFVKNVSDPHPLEDGDIEDNDVIDVNGHGSHCAGLAAGATNNGAGIASIGWGCRIMTARIGWIDSNGDGYGFSTDMARGFIYAADNGAHVASLSYGNSLAVLDGAEYAFLNDVCILTSAGNVSTDIFDPLSKVPWCINVGAVDPHDVIAWYSNFGEFITVCAPGGDHNPGLWSTTPANEFNNNTLYNSYSGTSMASPVAAGVLGLIRSQHPEWTNVQAYYQMVGTADNIDALNPDYHGSLGAGRVNALRALTETVVPKPKLKLKYVEFSDPTGNADGLIDPGEDINLVLHIENRWAGAGQVTAKVLSDNPAISNVTASVTIDTVYGMEDYPYDNTNAADPLIINIADNIPPMNIPVHVVLENTVFSDTFKVYIPVHTQVLIVEDVDDLDIGSYYFDAFEKLGIAYMHYYRTEPLDSALIIKFPVVIWGCEWAFPALDEDDGNVLGYYLENGGKLLLSGQDIGWDMCDEGGGNSYEASSGASKTWYEKYLASVYVSDAGGASPLYVTPGTSIFNDLEQIKFLQPGRAANSYPSEIAPTENGYSILQYENGNSGAVASDAPYKTVNFAFGGFEAISDTMARYRVMRDVINHLNGFNVNVTKLRNTEDTGPFTITAVPSINTNIAIAQLWYRYDDGDWSYIDMSDDGTGSYTADIPAISTTAADISYYTFFKLDNGVYNGELKHSFYSGPDIIAPIASTKVLPFDTIDKIGPYPVSIMIEDNISIDTNHVYVHFLSESILEDSILLTFEYGNIWSGEFALASALNDGDSIRYYFTFRDNGAVINYGRFPEFGYFSFKIQEQIVIDNFETSLSRWENEGVWKRYTDPTSVQEGISCLASGDGIKYPTEQDVSITYKNSLNLVSRELANISFSVVQWFDDNGDTVFFDIREGNAEWTTLTSFFGTALVVWKHYVFDLTPYCDSGHAPISIRFRLKSNDQSPVARLGVLIDNIQVLTDGSASSIGESLAAPLKFKLHSAYPNPFNATVTLPFEIPQPGNLEVVIYDILGKEIYHFNQHYPLPGTYTLKWQGRSNSGAILPSGLYLIRVKFNNQIHRQKIMLLK